MGVKLNQQLSDFVLAIKSFGEAAFPVPGYRKQVKVQGQAPPAAALALVGRILDCPERSSESSGPLDLTKAQV